MPRDAGEESTSTLWILWGEHDADGWLLRGTRSSEVNVAPPLKSHFRWNDHKDQQTNDIDIVGFSLTPILFAWTVWDGMVILVQVSSKSTLGDMNIRESAKFSQKTSGSESPKGRGAAPPFLIICTKVVTKWFPRINPQVFSKGSPSSYQVAIKLSLIGPKVATECPSGHKVATEWPQNNKKRGHQVDTTWSQSDDQVATKWNKEGSPIGRHIVKEKYPLSRLIVIYRCPPKPLKMAFEKTLKHKKIIFCRSRAFWHLASACPLILTIPHTLLVSFKVLKNTLLTKNLLSLPKKYQGDYVGREATLHTPGNLVALYWRIILWEMSNLVVLSLIWTHVI